MRYAVFAVACAVSIAAIATTHGASTDETSRQRALLDTYCISCHNQRARTAGLALDTLDLTDVARDAETWEKVVRKLRARVMPPSGARHPDEASYASFLGWLETELDRGAAAHPNPGRKDTFHRLNRTEYHNVVRDLLAVDVDVTDLLPVDNPSYGFDNIAGTLTLNDSLMEQYLAAAQTISSTAMGTTPLAFKEFRAPYFLAQDHRMDGAPIGTRGGLRAKYTFPQNGEYLIEVKLTCGPPNGVVNAVCDGAAGFLDPHDLEVTVDGGRVAVIPLPARPVGSGDSVTDRAADIGYKIRVPLKAGPHDVATWFLKHSSVEEFDGVRPKFDRPAYLSNASSAEWEIIFQPAVSSITVGGPYNPAGPGDTPSRRALLLCHPETAAAEQSCARRIAAALATRTFRRPASSAEIDDLMGFFEKGRQDGFESGIELMLRRILVSPNFLFRIERDPVGVSAQSNYRVTDMELASRISFFLWSSMPDDELLGLARQNRLSDPAVLAQQITRLLADSRAQDMMTDFAGQWLQLRKMDVVAPNAQMFPNFDESLRHDLRVETELFVDSIRREDRSVVDLLTADYSFLNERLATHYGITGVKGSRFRRVTYGPNSSRRGLLGQGSVLTVTSSPIRTRPVVRGKWILENLLGTPPPAPPANVPPLKETGNVLAQTMRERMATHRANAVCATCHSMIDPLGFALENFNPVGQYRAVDENFTPIDASGALPDGTRFDDGAAFRAAIVKNPDVFVNTLTEKLLTYALGRGLEAYDMPAVRKIVRDAARSNYRFSSVVVGIVNSLPFQKRRSTS